MHQRRIRVVVAMVPCQYIQSFLFAANGKKPSRGLRTTVNIRFREIEVLYLGEDEGEDYEDTGCHYLDCKGCAP